MTAEELRALEPGDITYSENSNTGKWWSVILGLGSNDEAHGFAFRFYLGHFYIYKATTMYFDANERHATEDDLRSIFDCIFRADSIRVEQ